MPPLRPISLLRTPFEPCPNHSNQKGSIALEYILISAFTAIIAVAAITYVSKVITAKTADLEETVGIKFDGIPNLGDATGP